MIRLVEINVMMVYCNWESYKITALRESFECVLYTKFAINVLENVQSLWNTNTDALHSCEVWYKVLHTGSRKAYISRLSLTNQTCHPPNFHRPLIPHILPLCTASYTLFGLKTLYLYTYVTVLYANTLICIRPYCTYVHTRRGCTLCARCAAHQQQHRNRKWVTIRATHISFPYRHMQITATAATLNVCCCLVSRQQPLHLIQPNKLNQAPRVPCIYMCSCINVGIYIRSAA